MPQLARISPDAIVLLDGKPHTLISQDHTGLALRPLDHRAVTRWLSHDETVDAFRDLRLTIGSRSGARRRGPAVPSPDPDASLTPASNR